MPHARQRLAFDHKAIQPARMLDGFTRRLVCAAHELGKVAHPANKNGPFRTMASMVGAGRNRETRITATQSTVPTANHR